MPAVRMKMRLPDREEISRSSAEGLALKQIAVLIGRNPSLVSREVARHGGRERYWAATADTGARAPPANGPRSSPSSGPPTAHGGVPTATRRLVPGLDRGPATGRLTAGSDLPGVSRRARTPRPPRPHRRLHRLPHLKIAKRDTKNNAGALARHLRHGSPQSGARSGRSARGYLPCGVLPEWTPWRASTTPIRVMIIPIIACAVGFSWSTTAPRMTAIIGNR